MPYLNPILIALATLVLSSPANAVQGGSLDCAEVKTTAVFGPPAGGVVEEFEMQGATPDSLTQARIDEAKAKIAAWYDLSCDPPLPEIECTGLLAGSVPADDVLAGVDICVETVNVDNPANTGPAPGSYMAGGLQIDVTGTSINVHPDKWFDYTLGIAESKLGAAASLLHEAYHVKNRNVPASGKASRQAAEKDAWAFTGDFFCALAGCLPTGTQKKQICNLHTRIRVKVAKPPLCLTLGPCPECPNTPNVRVPTWIPGSPPVLLDRSEDVTYSVGPVGSPGTFALFPNTRDAQAIWADSNHDLVVTDIDFAQEILGFQPTCMEVIASSSNIVDRIAIGGYDLESGLGKVVSVSFDTAATPPYTVQVEYDGPDLGVPLDMCRLFQSPNKGVVLEEGGTVSLVQFVTGNVTVLATIADAPTLGQVSYISASKGFLLPESSIVGVITATDEAPIVAEAFPSSDAVIVKLYDEDGDGEIDGVFEN